MRGIYSTLPSIVTAMTQFIFGEPKVTQQIKPADQTGGPRDYAFHPGEEETKAELYIRDNRPEWQKIGDRKGRSRPNKKK